MPSPLALAFQAQFACEALWRAYPVSYIAELQRLADVYYQDDRCGALIAEAQRSVSVHTMWRARVTLEPKIALPKNAERELVLTQLMVLEERTRRYLLHNFKLLQSRGAASMAPLRTWVTTVKPSSVCVASLQEQQYAASVFKNVLQWIRQPHVPHPWCMSTSLLWGLHAHYCTMPM